MSSPSGTMTPDPALESKLQPSAPASETAPSPPPAGPQLTVFRKYLLLVIFCLAQFLDVFNFAAIFVAIPAIATDLNINISDTVWIVSAFQLTFASFLLMSGRISDIYDPKHCFIAGAFILGALSIGCGFVRNAIGLFVLRALSGIGASLTIPSAFGLIIRFFPDPHEQAIAIGAFGGSGAVGNALGVIVSALFIQFATWHWVFWFSACIALPIAGVCAVLIPAREHKGKKGTMKNLDVIGVSILTAALVLFIFALTSGANVGWKSAEVLAPLIISVFLVAGFLYWETLIPEENAALPPRMWFYPNFAVLFGISLSPYLWWTTTFLLITSLWQDVFGWSAIKSGVHFLPIGIPSLPLTIFAGYITRFFKPKWIILAGGFMLIASTALLPFAGQSSENRYWRIDFPGFVLGTMGATLVYTGASVAMFQTTPPAYAATVGAIFNAALQLGSAVGSSAIASIEANVGPKHPDDPYAGRAAGFWFLFALVVTMTLAVAVLYRTKKPVESSTPEEKQA